MSALLDTCDLTHAVSLPPSKWTTQLSEAHGGCYDGVIVTCYNQVTRRGRKRKEKYFKYYFSFGEEDSFLPLERRVELKLDLAWYYDTMENQDVTWPGAVECLVLYCTV
jgi:hypothetical protein